MITNKSITYSQSNCAKDGRGNQAKKSSNQTFVAQPIGFEPVNSVSIIFDIEVPNEKEG